MNHGIANIGLAIWYAANGALRTGARVSGLYKGFTTHVGTGRPLLALTFWTGTVVADRLVGGRGLVVGLHIKLDTPVTINGSVRDGLYLTLSPSAANDNITTITTNSTTPPVVVTLGAVA